jgi:hypothetical protein
MNDHDLILAIQELLDGVEWSANTACDIAALLNENGYPVLDYKPAPV